MKMNMSINKAAHFTLAALCVAGALLAVPPAVLADDTEVFFPPTPISGSGSKDPNILFIIDDSGSMKTVDSGETQSRLKRVQDAFSLIMDDMNASTNVGLMRFSYSEGGPVIFPVSPIEKLIKDVHSSFATINQVAEVSVNTDANEAEQLVSNGAVTIKQSPIYFGYKSVLDLTVTQEAEQANGSTTVRCDSDAVDTSTACGSGLSGDLEFNKTGLPSTTAGQWVGLRFTRVALPTDFVATDARLVFTAAEDDADPLSLRIYGSKNNRSLTFSQTNASVSGGVNGNVTPTASARLPTTTSGGSGYIPWNNVAAIDQADPLSSPNIAALVNEIKNCNTGGNNCGSGNTWLASPSTNQNVLAFMITGDPSAGTGRRRLETRANTSTTLAPKLQIAYNSSAAAPQVITGLRFPDVQVPKGVVITSATLKFKQDALGGAGNLKLKISIQDTDDAAAFTTSTNNITSRSWYASPVITGFAVPTWNNPYGNQSIDVTNLLKQVVTRSGWCAGKAVAFKFEVDSGSDADSVRRALSSSQDDSSPPTLLYSYSSSDAALESGCAGNTATSAQIGAAVDDGRERPADGTGTPVLTGDNPLVFGCNNTTTCGVNAQITALRFTGIGVPQGSVLNSVFLDLRAYAQDTTSGAITVRAQNVDDGPQLNTTQGDLRWRLNNQATTGVGWTFSRWTANTTYSSPDIKAAIQPVFNRAGWVKGNALVLLIDGTGRRRAYAYDDTPSKSAKIRISYQATVGKLTVRNYLKRLVNGLTPYSNTPSVETLYEAARYMRGEDAFYGRTRGFGSTIPASPSDSIMASAPNLSVSHPSTFKAGAGGTHNYPAGCTTSDLSNDACALENYTGTTTYQSPMQDACQQNNIVFLTDGLPNNNEGVAKVQALTGVGSCTAEFDGGGTCAKELAGFMFNNDQQPSALPGVQRIRTFTIGLAIATATPWLTSIAQAGGGQYFSATSASDLVTAFQAIISSILDVDTSFVAPAVTVNTFNRLTNRNELYFALFKPNLTVNWIGNLKRYQLRENAAAGTPDIYDKNNNLAVDTASGFFKDTACSFWTATCPDGPAVELGGVASKMTSSRNIYTYNGDSPNNADLTATPLSTTTVSNADLGATDDTDRANIIAWAKGMDMSDDDGDGVTAEARQYMGDPLHSEPTLIAYGGTDAAPDLAVFVGDNQGYLHAFNATTDASLGGTEYFSFVPKALLKNLRTYYNGDGSYKDRPYGMDGSLTTWVKDTNQDGIINGSDFAYLYAGMRRGGRNFYALDVTSRTAPKLKWNILGGTAGSFIEMGQSWPQPNLSAIRFNNVDYNGTSTSNPPVLIISGGYDPAQDTKTNLFSGGTRLGDAYGRAIYVVNAETGALLWWAGYKDTAKGTNPNLAIQDMVYSIPAAPAAVDVDADGMVDRIYFTDAGGQVFRIILGNDASGKPSLSNATGGIIAKLSVDGAAGSRHFFNTPDVALITEKVSTPFISVSIGSGHRERPLDTSVQDRFYVLKDPDLTNDAPSALMINGDADLYDATANLAGSSDPVVAAQAKADIAAKKGLYIKFGTGEKSLTDSITFNNQVLFATFTPGVSAAESTCQATQGVSRFYRINIADATPALDFDGNGVISVEDRSRTIAVAGLPPDPVILFPSIRVITHDDGTKEYKYDGNDGALVDPIVLIGAVRFNLNTHRQVQKSWWRQN